MTDYASRISAKRPRWWLFCPWLYALILEDYLREALERLEEDEEETTVVEFSRAQWRPPKRKPRGKGKERSLDE